LTEYLLSTPILQGAAMWYTEANLFSSIDLLEREPLMHLISRKFDKLLSYMRVYGNKNVASIGKQLLRGKLETRTKFAIAKSSIDFFQHWTEMSE
jgi:hypothetical protein